MKTGGEKDVLGVHVRPSTKVLAHFGWDEVLHGAKAIIPQLTHWPNVEDIKKNPKCVTCRSAPLEDGQNILIIPYENACGRTIIIMFDWEQSRRKVMDGSHSFLDRD